MVAAESRLPLQSAGLTRLRRVAVCSPEQDACTQLGSADTSSPRCDDTPSGTMAEARCAQPQPGTAQKIPEPDEGGDCGTSVEGHGEVAWEGDCDTACELRS